MGDLQKILLGAFLAIFGGVLGKFAVAAEFFHTFLFIFTDNFRYVAMSTHRIADCYGKF